MSRRPVTHERSQIPVPREVRRALCKIDHSVERIARTIGVSTAAAEALLSPFGVVSPSLLEKVKAKLDLTASAVSK